MRKPYENRQKMSTRETLILFIGAVVLYVLIGHFVMTWHGTEIEKQTGMVWTAYELAFEKISRLEGQMGAFMDDRQEIFTTLSNARNDFLAAKAAGDLEAAHNARSNAQIEVDMLFEQQPNLDLSVQATTLMDETSGAFNRIKYERDELIEIQGDYKFYRGLFIIQSLYVDQIEILGSNTNPTERLPESTL